MKVLLVIVFGVVELGRRLYLGCDRSEASCRQLFLVEIT